MQRLSLPAVEGRPRLEDVLPPGPLALLAGCQQRVLKCDIDPSAITSAVPRRDLAQELPCISESAVQGERAACGAVESRTSASIHCREERWGEPEAHRRYPALELPYPPAAWSSGAANGGCVSAELRLSFQWGRHPGRLGGDKPSSISV